MKMTKEKAIAQIEKLKSYCEYMGDSDESGAYLFDLDVQALDFALSVLHSITREQVKKMRGEIVETVEKGRMKRVFSCCGCDFTSLTCWITPKFCPSCGAPMTDEAVDMVMKKLEAVRNES